MQRLRPGIYLGYLATWVEDINLPRWEESGSTGNRVRLSLENKTEKLVFDAQIIFLFHLH